MGYITGTRFPCPSCNQMLSFKAGTTAILICPQCREVIEREAPVHQPYQVVAIPEGLSVIQLGTTGLIEQQSFEVIGRLRLQFKDGYLNLWSLVMGNGLLGWLVESFGQYALCVSYKLPAWYDWLVITSVGDSIQLRKSENFCLDMVQECIDFDKEGELPTFTTDPRYSQHFELSKEDGACAFAWKENEHDALAFIGKYYEFSQFNFTNLRTLNEWF
jgi:phage FluMu protein Com